MDDNLTPEEVEDLSSQVSAICEAGRRLHLPVTPLMFEIKASATSVGSSSLGMFRVIIIAEELEDGIAACCLVQLPQIHGKSSAGLIGSKVIIDRETGVPRTERLYEDNSTGGTSFPVLCDVVGDFVKSIIVLSLTKGVRMEDRKGNKLVLVGREHPKDRHVLIKIGQARKDSTAAASVAHGGIRKKMRLHMRRGHYRHQRWGHQRKRIKLIWLDPVLVGYEEEGKITHEYEIVGEHHDEPDTV